MAFCFGEPETSAGQVNNFINGHLTGVTKRKILLAHEDNSTLEELSIESENIMQMHLVESLFGSQN